MAKEALLVVCPGRGTYNKAELGYLKQRHADKADFIAAADAVRAANGGEPLSALDGEERFSPALHTRGDVASPLIHACAFLDFLDIDRERFSIAAVTGNSMGWYTALACAGAVSGGNGFAIVDAMGRHSQAGEAGGQVLLTLVGEDWRPLDGLKARVLDLVAAIGARSDHRLFLSIDLGGMLVLAGNEAGLAALLAEAPETPGRAPMRLTNHGPFHTPLMQGSSKGARASLPADWFSAPERPMIDGRGQIWRPFASNAAALWDYTFGAQILTPYDFTRATQVAVREFAPDRIVLLGPGDTLGGAIAQALIGIEWLGLTSKADFQAMQAQSPLLISMGRDEQRGIVTA